MCLSIKTIRYPDNKGYRNSDVIFDKIKILYNLLQFKRIRTLVMFG